MDMDNFLVYVKSEKIYVDLSGDVKKQFDTSHYRVKRSIKARKNKKKIGLMKNELN